MKFSLSTALFAGLSSANGQIFATDYTAGGTDVAQHGNIDLDMTEILNDVTAAALATQRPFAALDIYTDGKNSVKSSGKRKLTDFSTEIKGKALTARTENAGAGLYDMPYNEMAYSLAEASGYADSYANTMTLKYLNTTTPLDVAVAASINFGNTQMYTMHELYDAVKDATAGSQADNDNGVHAWDEAVAFYAGGTQVKGAAHRNSMYGMIEEVAKHFGDAGSDTAISPINEHLMAKFNAGLTLLDAAPGSGLTEADEIALLNIAEEIHGLFTAANIQWFIHAHKAATTTFTVAEKAALLEIFATQIYPELNACSKDDAVTFLASTITTPADISDNWVNIMTALQTNYHCMIRVEVSSKFHQSCVLVGAYAEAGGTATQAACVDTDIHPYESTQKSVGGTMTTVSKTVVGYEPDSDVAMHSLVDKDMRRIGLLAGSGDFTNALMVYKNGWNSWKMNDDGTFTFWRNFAGFANDNKLALTCSDLSTGTTCAGKSWGPDLNTYYGSYEALDTFITGALKGEAIAAGSSGAAGDIAQGFAWNTDSTARKEMAGKTIQFGLNMYYVIREFTDAIQDCDAKDLTSNIGNVHAWDEGVMFWAGSMADGSTDGELGYMLGEKRAGNYDYTQFVHGKTASSINADLIALMDSGRSHLVAGDCHKAVPIVEELVPKLIAPIIQGAQRYAWKVGSGASNTAKSRAEGWAFAKSILPMVHACSAENAAIIAKNMDYFATTPMTDGTAAVFEAWQKTFSCLGVTCKDIGELNESSDGADAPPACKDTFEDSDLDGSASTTGVKAGAALAAAVAGVAMLM